MPTSVECLSLLHLDHHTIRDTAARLFPIGPYGWEYFWNKALRPPLPVLETTHSLPFVSTLTTLSSATTLFTMSPTASLIHCFQCVNPPKVLNSPR
jgi:hypothetical protein